MQLNSLKSARGARPAAKRVGRGIGSGYGKTCGRGHKGQKSRSGGFHRVGFEGGQMPLQRRLPKRGFASRRSIFTAEVRLYQLSKLAGDVFTLEALKSAGVVSARVQRVKIIKSGSIEKAVTLQGLAVTAGARAAIESAGGKIES